MVSIRATAVGALRISDPPINFPLSIRSDSGAEFANADDANAIHSAASVQQCTLAKIQPRVVRHSGPSWKRSCPQPFLRLWDFCRTATCAWQTPFDSGRARAGHYVRTGRQEKRQSKRGKEAKTGSSERKSDRSRRSLRRLLEERHSR
jgi:hypothetical protein